ncbi:MAG: lipopolysaccharide biosynthesis protein [Pseudomonadota bacterium]
MSEDEQKGADAPAGQRTARLASATGWIFAGRLVVRSFALLSTVILARLLTPEDFGIVAIATAFVFIAEAVSGFQFNAALIARREVKDSDWDAAFTLNLLRGLTLSALTVLAAPLLAGVLERPDATLAIAATGLFPLITSVRSPRFIEFEKRLSMRQYFMSELATNLGRFVASVGVALVYPTYWALIVGLIAGVLLQVTVTHLYAPYRPRLTFKGARSLLSFSLWITGTYALNTIGIQSSRFILLTRLDVGTVGVFKLGQDIATMLTADLIHPISRSLFPAFAEIANDRARLREAYLMAQTGTLLIGLPMSFGLALVAEPLVLLLLGEAFREATLVVEYVAFASAFQVMETGVVAILMAMQRPRAVFLLQVFVFCTRIPMMIAGVWLGGLEGLLAAYFASVILSALVSIGYVQRLLGIRPGEMLWRARLCLGAAITMAGALLALQGAGTGALPYAVELLLLVGTGALVYAAALLAYWRLAGAPDGAERRIAGIAKARLGRVGARLGRAAGI